MRTAKQRRAPQPPPGTAHVPIRPPETSVHEIDDHVRDLIHMMMRVRQLEFDLLGRYLYLRNFQDAEKVAFVEALERIVASGELITSGSAGLPRPLFDPDLEVASNRCPVGFHEVDGRCVPD